MGPGRGLLIVFPPNVCGLAQFVDPSDPYRVEGVV